MSFTADATNLTAGQCTTLRWDVEYATAVFLNGEGVVGHDTRQVCPTGTTTYSLHVQAPSGDVDKSITINVTAPPTDTPTATPTPSLQPPNAPSGGSYDRIGCSTIQIVWRDNATNEDGFYVYRDGSLYATLGQDAAFYYDSDASTAAYTYDVYAYNKAGMSAPATIFVPQTIC